MLREGACNDTDPNLEDSPLHLVEKYVSPYEWPNRRKQLVVLLSCAAAVFASFASSSYAPSKDQLISEWQFGDVAILVGITVFTTGFGLAPMVFAPISEVLGRRPIFGATGALLIACQIWCALTDGYI